MKIVDAGHEYLLDELDTNKELKQRLTFVKRRGPGYPFNHGYHEGTNCQEVLRALIDRTEYLNKQVPCAETESALGLLKAALFLFEVRAARRHGRQLSLHETSDLLRLPACKKCGHVGCEEEGEHI